MYWGNVLFPALTLLWAIAGAVLHRKIGFSRYLCGLLAGVSIDRYSRFFSIVRTGKSLLPWIWRPNSESIFAVWGLRIFCLSFPQSCIYRMRRSYTGRESKVSRKYHNTSLFLFGQLSSKLATNTKTMTIICVTLTFSICLFVIAPVLTGWSLGYLDSRAVYDIQISSRYNDVYEVEKSSGYRLWGNYCVHRTKQHSDKGRFDFFGISSPKKRLSPAGKVRFSSLGDCTEGL